MTTTRFKLEEKGPIARLTLCNGPLNLLDIPFMTELAATVRRLDARPAAERPRVLLLSSAVPGQFSQGIDPKAVLGTDVAGRKRVFLALADLVEALWLGGLPVVADVSGLALAGGAVLATLADFALIDANSGRISYSEVKVGLPVPAFVQLIVRSKVSPASWNEILLLGKNIDAQEAVRIGFAQAAYKTTDERDELLEGLLGRVARLPPAVVAQTRREGRRAAYRELEAFRADLGAFADYLTDDYLGKGLAAVAKGESPRF